MPISIDDLLAAHEKEEPELYEFTLTTGETLKAWTVNDSERLDELQEKTAALKKVLESENVPAPFAPYKGVSAQTLAKVIIVSELMEEPKFSTVKALRSAKKAGPMFSEIANTLLSRVGGSVARAEEKKVEAEKNA